MASGAIMWRIHALVLELFGTSPWYDGGRMAEQHRQPAARPILATLLSGVLPGSPGLSSAVTAFRQALATASAETTEAQVDEALTVFGEACIVFSDSGRALDWLTLPSDVFGGKPPLAMMHDPEGRDAVKAQLARIEHGIFY